MAELTHADVVSFDAASRNANLAPKTIEKRLTTLHTFFGWAQTYGFYPVDVPLPTSQISKLLRRQHVKQQSRQRFSFEELALIFDPKEYLARNRRPDWFWLPFLGLYSGARIEELVQLCVDDIEQDGVSGRFFISFNDQNEKSIKNKNSIRKVPLHSKLVELGFLRYVEEIRQLDLSMGRLFPHLRGNKYGVLSTSASKHFSRDLRALGILDRSRVFHSFRHTVATELRDRGVDPLVRHRLLGHALGEGEHAGYLHGDIPLPVLADGIENLRYECGHGNSVKHLNLKPIEYRHQQFGLDLGALVERLQRTGISRGN